MKTKLFVVVVLLLSVAMLTTGAFAYFSAKQTITGSQISAGTLQLQLSNDGTSWGNSAEAWALDGMAPGDFVEQTIWMKNTGSIDAGQVRYDWSDLLQTPAGVELAKQLIIVDIRDNMDSGNVVSIFNNSYGIHNLYELAEFKPGAEGWDAFSGNFFPFLDANGGTGWLYMKLQFNPEANNTFQGAAVIYNLSIEAVQQKIY